MKVKIIDLGRNHWNGEIECAPGAILPAVEREAKKHLLSRVIEAGDNGNIYAGMRPVGRWEATQ